MTRTVPLAPLFAALILGAGLAACEPRDAAPSGAGAVQQPTPQAPPRPQRTGAEIQDRAMNRTIQAVYLCENGERLTVDFDNPRQMATVRDTAGQAVDLVQQRAADGIWYRASGSELRGRGNQATWTGGGREPTECRAVD